MRIRFQADADLNEDIIVGVQRREPDIDFRRANEAGLQGRSDFEVLEIAARDNRIIVPQDFKTMPAAFARFIERRTSPGVLIVPQTLEFATAIESRVMIWAASEATEWSNSVCRIPL